jgi:hypothetical protein
LKILQLAHGFQGRAAALPTQTTLSTASPGSLAVPLAALVVSASLFTLSSQIGVRRRAEPR